LPAGHEPFGRAKAGATPKQRILFRLMQQRVHLLGAYQGLAESQLLEPMTEGGESVRDALTVLAAWELATVDALATARAGERPAFLEWKDDERRRWAAGQRERTRSLAVDDVVRGLQVTRLELLDQMEAMPEEPAEMWTAPHPVGALIERLSANDLELADAIKRWRSERGY
jgi:hypothetical protein